MYEIKRLKHEQEKLQESYQRAVSDSMKSEGDKHTSSATIGRLNAQVTQMQRDLDLMTNEKSELEKIITN